MSFARRSWERSAFATLALLALLTVSSGDAAEDCSLLGRIPDCPPSPSGCGLTRDCPPQDCSTCTGGIDDDGDCALDEETLNGVDDDGDGMIDEDISCLNSCDPLNYACPSVLFDRGELTVPHPAASRVSLPARVRAYSCGGGESFRELELVLEPDPDSPEPFCGGYRLLISLAEAGGGSLLFRGPAILVHSRSWESLDRDLLSPPALGNVAQHRYVLRADLARSVAQDALPSELAPPCMADVPGFPHFFLYGHLDLAVDTADAGHDALAVALHHAPSSLSHPPTFGAGFCENDTITGRPIAPGGPGSHDGGWMVVAPSDRFTFSTATPILDGEFRHGRVRAIPTGDQPCEKETRICVSQFEPPAPPSPAGACSSNEVYRHVRYCANEPTAICQNFALSSDERCDTIPDDLVAFFPAGHWDGSAFPGGLELSFFEGALSCVPPSATPWRPYWYGSSLQHAAGGLWRAPERSLDLIDNQHVDSQGSGLWKIGAVNWIFEGTANEVFFPLQFRTMAFFPDQNPDIPTLAPCVATATITEAAVDCGDPTLPRGSCLPGEALRLSGECSEVLNCCQCGGLEYQWSRHDGTDWQVMQPWSDDPLHAEDPGPMVSTDYRLELRCSTSRIACVDEATFRVEVEPAPTASPTAVPEPACLGEPVALDAGACARCTCAWTATPGPDPLDDCNQLVSPQETTTYTVVVTDPLTGCSSAPAEILITPVGVVAGAVADLETCSCDSVELSGVGQASDCPSGLEYRWRRTAPTMEWVCGDELSWLTDPAPGTQFPCTPTDCAGTFELQVRCVDAADCVATATTTISITPLRAALSGGQGCDVATVELDASGTSAPCPDPEFRFLDPSGAVARDWSTEATHAADAAGEWTVEVRCPGDARCADQAVASVLLERSPSFDTATAVDPERCEAGLLVSWQAASFHGGAGGSYSIYRSSTSCLDALAAPPIVSGSRALEHLDAGTVPGSSYFYVVEAEDAVPASACVPGGPVNGGAITRVCFGPVTDEALPPPPGPACRALRVAHVGHELTVHWESVRPLLSGEHFHLLKTVDDPTTAFDLVNPEADTRLSHVETDPSSALQFFDLRIANSCERVSGDEFPAGIDVVPHADCP